MSQHTKYAVTIINTKTFSAHSFVTNHWEKVDETEAALEDHEIMFHNTIMCDDANRVVAFRQD
jgi:hypothetical protein